MSFILPRWLRTMLSDVSADHFFFYFSLLSDRDYRPELEKLAADRVSTSFRSPLLLVASLARRPRELTFDISSPLLPSHRMPRRLSTPKTPSTDS